MEKRITSGVLKEILLKELGCAKNRKSISQRRYTFYDGKGIQIDEEKPCKVAFLTDIEISVLINLVVNYL